MSTKLAAGTTVIKLNDQDITLTASLQALATLSNLFDGLEPLNVKLAQRNLTAVVAVIRHGCRGMTDAEGRQLPARVYRNGLTAELVIPLMRFVSSLGNSGEAPAELEELVPADPDTATEVAEGNA